MKRTFPKIISHVLFWIGVWFFFYYFFSYNSTDRGYVIWFASLLLPLTIAITYFLVYYLIPKFLFPKQYGRFALFTFYTLLASSYFIVVLIYGVLIIYKRYDATNIPPMVKNFFFILILVYMVVGLVSFARILNRSLTTEKKNKELQNKMLSAQLHFKEQELYYLKKQIHPHFLFNTLNTIYGLALKQSEHTPEVILKLSNLLDYILYQVDNPRVSLKEEVLHIKEYIELEKIRFQDSLNVVFNSNEIDGDIQIAPMLLMPFVENAFKHGARKNGCLEIQIDIKAENRSLAFCIKNSVLPTEAEEGSPGIGLENFRKRLDLHFSGKYTLETEISDEWYNARLTIPDLNEVNEG
ncbi:MAG: histidine kinase [Bacteroidales bacterium]